MKEPVRVRVKREISTEMDPVTVAKLALFGAALRDGRERLLKDLATALAPRVYVLAATEKGFERN